VGGRRGCVVGAWVMHANPARYTGRYGGRNRVVRGTARAYAAQLRHAPA